MSQYTDHVEGYYTADGSAKNITLPFVPSSVEVFIQGNSSGNNWDSTANPGVVKRAWWMEGMAQGTALAVKNTDGAATDQSLFVSSLGITQVEAGQPILGAALSGSGVSQANPAVVTVAGHGYSTGDYVLLLGTTGMLQISGFVFQITVTGANTFTIPLNTSGFAAAATAVVSRKIMYPDLYTPNMKFVTAISKASQAVISTSTPHNFVVGETVRLSVSNLFGMTQMDGLSCLVTAVSSLSVTVDVDSTNFTTFAFPTSTSVAGGYTQPQIFPDAITGTDAWPSAVDAAYQSTAFRGFSLGSTVAGPSGALVLWKAYKDLSEQ